MGERLNAEKRNSWERLAEGNGVEGNRPASETAFRRKKLTGYLVKKERKNQRKKIF